ncbi:phosphate/phosphite/phosphonate ABC transporter substrate-binding protein [Novosphingobium sp. JCM 18896]|uniref:phosphate/phosphite/phosphonate ABC transporter substrate-binding protein n=1 Tax=Novosphingobium sp. JCM 18896 TaxID=2989731 RepID=UPI0022225C52|nr:phosphate/phosphite/phosphonate ABC transporter substrate-binding protein [Novosphingobium sp. JCM 18896]MCW1429721.1 phosphate/phosphite/phosphonate ABC transporter substrate-binding protein [Novosphingobium sp. JCM 18896]
MTGSRKHQGTIVAFLVVAALLLLALATGACGRGEASDAETPIRVVLIPADGGTASGTLADYRPLFDTLSRSTGMRFELTITQSYGAAVEGICNGVADLAFVGPATYLQARDRGCAQLLAVGIKNGQPRYYAAFFVRSDAPLRGLADLAGKRVAFGDINSTSSFLMPVAMLMEARLDPARDLSAVRLTGSHPNSLNALLQGQVDAAALSLDSYDRALRAGVPGAEKLRVLARSEAMPYPPFIVSTRLPAARREILREGFSRLAQDAAITQGRITGYGGGAIEGYATHFSDAPFDSMARRIARVTPALKAALLERAAQQ